MLITQWHNVSISCKSFFTVINSTAIAPSNQNVCTHTGDDILKFYGAESNDFTLNIALLTILGITFHLAAFTSNLIRFRRAV
jgi:hypothetical protein